MSDYDVLCPKREIYITPPPPKAQVSLCKKEEKTQDLEVVCDYKETMFFRHSGTFRLKANRIPVCRGEVGMNPSS